MATDLGEETLVGSDDESSSTGQTRPASHFNLGRQQIKLFGLLIAVMAVQVAVGYLLLPDPAASDTRQVAGPSQAGLDNPAENIETVEVELDPPFNPTNSQAVPGAITHVTFRLAAVVSAGQAHAFDQAVRKTHEARVRQAIIKVVRSSSLQDLSDPNLTVIKRKIREEINKALRKSYVIEVVISDFTMMEQ